MASQIQQLKEYLRNNPNLKSANTKQYIDKDTFKWRIQEMQKIVNDIIYFAKKYFYIISLDHGKTLINPYPKQEEVIRNFVNYNRNIVLSCRQSGKCLQYQSLITIRNKKTNQIQTISIGDFFERVKNN